MRLTRILNANQKIFGIYINDIFPIAFISLVLTKLMPRFEGLEILVGLICYCVCFYLRTHFRKGFILDLTTEKFVLLIARGIYGFRKNNWNDIL